MERLLSCRRGAIAAGPCFPPWRAFVTRRQTHWPVRAWGGCAGQPAPWLRLDGLHHALPQEPDARPAIALALEQLQAVDLALDRPIAPGQGEPRCDRLELLPQALGKACKRLNPARGGLGHPGLQGITPALPHERQKRLAQRVGLPDGVVHLPELVDIELGILRPLGFGAHPGERDGAGRWPLRAGVVRGLGLGGPAGFTRPAQSRNETRDRPGRLAIAQGPEFPPE